jgi:hypothetical protein
MPSITRMIKERRRRLLVAWLRDNWIVVHGDMLRLPGLSEGDRRCLAPIIRRSIVVLGLQDLLLQRAHRLAGFVSVLAAGLAGPLLFGKLAMLDTPFRNIALPLGFYVVVLTTVAAVTLGDRKTLPVGRGWLIISSLYAFAIAAMSWIFRELESDPLFVAFGSAGVAFLALLALRAFIMLLDRYVSLPLIARWSGTLTPSETATVYAYGLMVEFMKARAWRAKAQRQRLITKVDLAIEGLRRDIPRALRCTGAAAGGSTDVAIRQRVSDLADVLAELQVNLLHATSRSQLDELQRTITIVTVVLANGKWVAPAHRQTFQPRSRARRFWVALPGIAVPLALAGALPFLPINLPPGSQQLTQILFLLSALLSVPGIEPATRADALGALRQAASERTR